MSNIAMRNETDLDWLARNVHEWHRSASHASVGANYPAWTYAPRLQSDTWFTEQQWLTRRAELQNKPSWADAPEWATHLIQTMAGLWLWLSHKPNGMDDNGVMNFRPDARSEKAIVGEALGDWRDTLDRRPFNPLTSIEDNQGQAMQDNGWFERGELPPAGAECEFCHSDDEWTDWHACIFVGKDAHGAGVISIIGDDAGMLYRSSKPEDFRPIRTERDQLADLLTQAGITTCIDQATDAILAAGFKLVAS